MPCRPQAADKHFPGGLEGPQALQSGFVSPGFAGRAGSLRPWAQTFLKHLAKKAAIGGLFRQTVGGMAEAMPPSLFLSGNEKSRRVIFARRPFWIAYESVLALACSLSFLFTFHAGLFIMLTLTSLCQNTCASTLTFEPLQSAFQGFILADAYLGHCYPSPRSYRLAPRTCQGHMATMHLL